MKLLLGILNLVFFSFSFMVSVSAAYDYNPKQITTNSYNDVDPKVNSSGHIVWYGNNGTDDEIFLYDGSSVTQLTNNSSDDYQPQISDNGQVVWAGYDGTDWEIFLYNGSTITQLTDNSRHDLHPQINANGQVVWMGFDGWDYEIVFYDGSTTKILTDNWYSDYFPQINVNGHIVWHGGEEGEDFEIHLYNGATTLTITDNTFNEYFPKINAKGYVVWHGFDGLDHEIFLYNGSATTQLTDNNFAETAPEINDGGNVVWSRSDGTDNEIFLYDGVQILQITNNSYNDYNPRISTNSYIAWTGNHSGYDEIFLYDGYEAKQITSNSFTDTGLQINAQGYMVWQGKTGGADSEIYIAKPNITESPLIAQTPMLGPAGATFMQWGTNFSPGGSVTLRFEKPDETFYPDLPVTASSEGSFEVSYESPADKPPGMYRWWAIDETTGLQSNIVSYLVTAMVDLGCTDTLEIKVYENQFILNPIAGALVSLYQEGQLVVGPVGTNAKGIYRFFGLSCGHYEVQVSKANYLSVNNLVEYVSNDSQNVLHIGLSRKAGEIPVIFVPGMLGSTIIPADPYPTLTPWSTPAGVLKTWDWLGVSGWGKLQDLLELNGFSILHCPWDWRMEVRGAYKKYLMAAIDKAKNETNAEKVMVVGHSMGGLLTRAYIQSRDYRNDIERFIMVGTPNQGSANAYYIWEGGDPKLVDDILSPFGYSIISPYSRSLERLWYTMGWHMIFGPWHNSNNLFIRTFIRSAGPSLRQLMYTESFLANPNRGSYLRNVDSQGNENVWLKNLNASSERFKMSSSGVVGTVLTAVIAEERIGRTIKNILVHEPSIFSLYDDGAPRGRNVDWAADKDEGGDGTVLFSSANRPVVEGWAAPVDRIVAQEDKHMGMPGKYSYEICNFLNGVFCRTSSNNFSVTSNGLNKPASMLTVTIAGNQSILLMGPDGKRAGINPLSGYMIEEISGASMSFRYGNGAVAIPDPLEGSYQMSLFGGSPGEYLVRVNYGDGNNTEFFEKQGYFNGTEMMFSVDLAGQIVPALTISTPVESVENLQVAPNPPTAMGGLTSLSWNASADLEVTGYRIYAGNQHEQGLSLLTEVDSTNTTYNTSIIWDNDISTPVTTFAVTAMKVGGEESFFSELVQNNDRDYDGLADEKEIELGTNIFVPDSDGDLIEDGIEFQYGIDPTLEDSDGDSFSDKEELDSGSDPLDPDSMPLDYAPRTFDDSVSMEEDSSLSINVLGNDGDLNNDPLSVQGVTQPTNGTVVNNGSDVTYTPAENFNGTDSFTYTATDGLLTSSATVTMTVMPVNDPVQVNDDNAATFETIPITIDVLANDSDIEGDQLKVTDLGSPKHGSCTTDGRQVHYTAPAGFVGTDNFTYSVTDGEAVSTATVTVTVQDAFNPVADLKANGTDSPLTISPQELLSLTAQLLPGVQKGMDADWWVAVRTPFPAPMDWYHYEVGNGWLPGLGVAYQGPCAPLKPKEVLRMKLPPGKYIFYFGVDMNMNGQLDMGQLHYDKAEVTVKQ